MRWFLPRQMLAAGLLLLMGSPALSQGIPLSGDTLSFEPLGDRPFHGLIDFDFGPDGSLYATDNGDLYVLLPGGEWEEMCGPPCFADYVLALGPDTLLVVGGIQRSVDGGETWEEVFEEGRAVLFEAPLSSTHEGLLLVGVSRNDSTGNATGAVYSTDRGATWALSTFEVPAEGPVIEAWDFAAFPEGHPWEDRLIFGGISGLAYSDDHGQTWTPSNVWETFVSTGVSLAVDENSVAYALAGHQGFVGVYSSTDGAAWEERSEGNEDFSFWYGHLVAIPGTEEHPGGGLLYVMKHPVGEEGEERSELWLSTDGAWTWELVGRIPVRATVEDALLGPDGRLYVALQELSPEEVYSYRTTEPVAVPIAGEEGPERPEGLTLTAHPNPSAGVVEVGLQVAEPVEARVAVFDLRGREVALLQNGPLLAGEHAFTWESTGAAAGVYVIRVKAGEAQASTRVTIAK